MWLILVLSKAVWKEGSWTAFKKTIYFQIFFCLTQKTSGSLCWSTKTEKHSPVADPPVEKRTRLSFWQTTEKCIAVSESSSPASMNPIPISFLLHVTAADGQWSKIPLDTSSISLSSLQCISFLNKGMGETYTFAFICIDIDIDIDK